MSTMDERLFALLDGSADLTSLLGSRIYPLRRPQNDPLPGAAYRRVARTAITVGGREVGVWRSRFEVSLYGTTPDAAKEVAREVSALLEDHTEPGWWGTTQDNELEFFDDLQGPARVSQDWIMYHDNEEE